MVMGIVTGHSYLALVGLTPLDMHRYNCGRAIIVPLFVGQQQRCSALLRPSNAIVRGRYQGWFFPF